MARPKVPAKVRNLLKRRSKIRLDLGGGPNPQKGFVVVDRRPLPGVDIVHDLESFPWPLPDNCCSVVLMSHLFEHISPSKTIEFMDEVWRILEHGGQAWIIVPYAGSHGYFQDPTHQNPCNESTFEYFAPILEDGRKSLLYGVYRPKPWMILKREMQLAGNLEVVMTAIKRTGKAKPKTGKK
jgi:hypothetical protein